MNEDAIPGKTINERFRQLIERYRSVVKILEAVNARLSDKGLLLRQGTIVYAMIIQAPFSTKKANRQRDSDIQQTEIEPGKVNHRLAQLKAIAQ